MKMLLPIPHPIRYDPSKGKINYFYEEVVKHLIPDIVKITTNGIPIDLDKVAKLEATVNNVLKNVKDKLSYNRLIQEYQAYVYPKRFKALKETLDSKKRVLDDYIKPYKGTMSHRTYAVNAYLTHINSSHTNKDKWTIKDLKGLNILLEDPIIEKFIKGEEVSVWEEAGMKDLAEEKLRIYNKSIDTKVIDRGTKEKLVPPFNPASSIQKREFFKYLNIDPIRFTDKNEPSWNREAIEELQQTLNYSDPELEEVLQLFVDHSYSAIIKNNFIEAFKKFTIDGVLYGNLKLFGAKSFRLTSNNPNLLNMPSTGSIYAKPLKECFVAPPGWVILTADYSALEDRVIANLSGDTNKIAIFKEGLDGHSLAATYYFKDRLTKLIGFYDDHKDAARQLKILVDKGDKEAKQIRQDSKPVTFGLSYGAYPQKVANTIGCSLEEAEAIFDAYHHEMFPSITKFREEITNKTKEQGYTHLGLGCRLYSKDVGQDIRTLFNANSQFWSILTLLTIHKMHKYIKSAGYEDDIKCISTIYDSIYFIVRKDVDIIRWLNNTLITTMCNDYLLDQEIPNEATAEIGDSWANLEEIPNYATNSEIEKVLNKFEKEIK